MTKDAVKKYTDEDYGIIARTNAAGIAEDPALYQSFYDKNGESGHWKADYAFWTSEEESSCI